MKNWVSQLRKGLTELVVLAALKSGEAYGYELLQRINLIDGLALTESTLYPLLARLKQEQFVKVRAAASPTGPPRRYYQLTTSGHRRFEEMLAYWKEIGASVDLIVKGAKR
jgi:PadR family transcriptional regulator PadR